MIIIFALGLDEFLHVSHFVTAREIWDTLQVSCECNIEVKRSRLSIFTHEYEIFMMKLKENISDMQK